MLDQYLHKICLDIRNAPAVAKHHILKSKKWTNSCYECLSDLITESLEKNLSKERQQQMGTTISSKTLMNMFNGQYRLGFPIDPRALNTLNKLVIFLGYADWNKFTAQADTAFAEKSAGATPEEQLEPAVRNALALRFSCLLSLPADHLKSLQSGYISSGPAYQEIAQFVHSVSASGYCLTNPYNPSAFELLDYEVLKADGKTAQVKTREYWLLCWWDPARQKYVERNKEMKEHIYVLEWRKDQWKIRTEISQLDIALPKSVRETVPEGQAMIL